MELSPSIFASESKSWQDWPVKKQTHTPPKNNTHPQPVFTSVFTWYTPDITISIKVVTLEAACKQNKCLGK